MSSDEEETSAGLTEDTRDKPASVSDDSCDCCSGDINQPTDLSLLSKTEKVYGHGSSIQKRCFLARILLGSIFVPNP